MNRTPINMLYMFTILTTHIINGVVQCGECLNLQTSGFFALHPVLDHGPTRRVVCAKIPWAFVGFKRDVLGIWVWPKNLYKITIIWLGNHHPFTNYSGWWLTYPSENMTSSVGIFWTSQDMEKVMKKSCCSSHHQAVFLSAQPPPRYLLVKQRTRTRTSQRRPRRRRKGQLLPGRVGGVTWTWLVDAERSLDMVKLPWTMNGIYSTSWKFQFKCWKHIHYNSSYSYIKMD